MCGPTRSAGSLFLLVGLSHCQLCPDAEDLVAAAMNGTSCDPGFFVRNSTCYPCEPFGGNRRFCPSTSGLARIVAPKYFSFGAGSRMSPFAATRTRTNEQLCPAGFYCKEGAALECPQGTYGKEEGLVSFACTANCAAGQFCPSGSVLPLACSTPAFFCPSMGTIVATDPGYESLKNGRGYYAQQIWYANCFPFFSSCPCFFRC